MALSDLDANDKKEGEWWYDDWSSFEEPSVSEEENEDFVKKDKQEVIEEKPEQQDVAGDHDDGTKKEDHEDCNFTSQTYNFMYENIGATAKNVMKKSKGLKVTKNDFVEVKGKKNFI